METQEVEIEKINAITRNLKEGDQEDKEFERRMKVADTLLKEKQIEGKSNVNRPRTPNDIPEVQLPVGAVEAGNPIPQGENGGVN